MRHSLRTKLKAYRKGGAFPHIRRQSRKNEIEIRDGKAEPFRTSGGGAAE